MLLFLKSPRPSLPLKRAPPLTPTLSPSGKREETAPPRRSEPLRSKVGGASKPSPDIVRDGTALLKVDRIIEVLVLWLLADNLQISCDFLGGFEKKA